MMEKFKLGAVVALNSGSPAMTVTGYVQLGAMGHPVGNVICEWFDGAKPQKGNFLPDALYEIETD